MSTIKKLNATNYQGEFEFVYNGKTVSGNFNTDGNKILNNINGSVKEGDAFMANFNAYRAAENKFNYNFSEIRSIADIEAIALACEGAVNAVIGELAER